MVTEVRDNPERDRYEIHVDGEFAGYAHYRGSGARRAFIHTEIDEKFAGHGLGSVLVKEALDDARAKGLHVLPFCPFVKGFIAEHPDYLDLVEPSQRGRFGL